MVIVVEKELEKYPRQENTLFKDESSEIWQL